MVQDIGQVDTSEQRGTDTSRSPVKPQSFPNHILLLPTVTGTHQCDGKGHHLEQGGKVLDRQCDFIFDQAVYPESPSLCCCFVYLGDGPMIPDIKQRRGGEESRLEECIQLGFAVEGMLSCQSY